MVADNGDTWVIERGPGHLRANCNGQDYAFNTESELWHKILDFDPSSYQTNDQSFELFHILDLNARGDHLEASPKRHQHQLTPLRSINQVIDGLQSDIQQAFRASPQVSMSDLVLLAQNLEPLYGEWRILEQLRARRINSFDGFALAKAEEAIHRLRQEVKILEDIQREAHHILDPSFAPSALRDRLSSIAERQNELRQELEAAELPAKFHDIPWEQVLSILLKDC